MALIRKDISFTPDMGGKMMYSGTSDRVKSILHRLFLMKPGDDTYNPEMGIDIRGKLFTVHAADYEDKTLAMEIYNQINQYTNFRCQDAYIRFSGKCLYGAISVVADKTVVNVQLETPEGNLNLVTS